MHSVLYVSHIARRTNEIFTMHAFKSDLVASYVVRWTNIGKENLCRLESDLVTGYIPMRTNIGKKNFAYFRPADFLFNNYRRTKTGKVGPF